MSSTCQTYATIHGDDRYILIYSYDFIAEESSTPETISLGGSYRLVATDEGFLNAQTTIPMNLIKVRPNDHVLLVLKRSEESKEKIESFLKTKSKVKLECSIDFDCNLDHIEHLLCDRESIMYLFLERILELTEKDIILYFKKWHEFVNQVAVGLLGYEILLDQRQNEGYEICAVKQNATLSHGQKDGDTGLMYLYSPEVLNTLPMTIRTYLDRELNGSYYIGTLSPTKHLKNNADMILYILFGIRSFSYDRHQHCISIQSLKGVSEVKYPFFFIIANPGLSKWMMESISRLKEDRDADKKIDITAYIWEGKSFKIKTNTKKIWVDIGDKKQLPLVIGRDLPTYTILSSLNKDYKSKDKKVELWLKKQKKSDYISYKCSTQCGEIEILTTSPYVIRAN